MSLAAIIAAVWRRRTYPARKARHVHKLQGAYRCKCGRAFSPRTR